MQGLRSLPSRIGSKIRENGECWEWTACTDRNGYGRVGWLGSVRYAHRVVYELIVGEIPDGLELDHVCRVRGCVNPDHLEPVTRAENVRRGDRFAYGSHERSRTHCPHGHPLDGRRSGGYRYCKTCARDRARKKRESLRAAA